MNQSWPLRASTSSESPRRVVAEYMSDKRPSQWDCVGGIRRYRILNIKEPFNFQRGPGLPASISWEATTQQGKDRGWLNPSPEALNMWLFKGRLVLNWQWVTIRVIRSRCRLSGILLKEGIQWTANSWSPPHAHTLWLSSFQCVQILRTA